MAQLVRDAMTTDPIVLDNTDLADVCSHELDSVAPDDEVEAVVAKFREHAIRRVPVLDNGVAVGILSIGDLAVQRDPDSALSDISAAPGNE